MKRTVLTFALILAMLCCAAHAEDTASLIIGTRTQQAFTDEMISEMDLNTILEAGLAAPSAINQQPWFFAVVTNQDVIDEIKNSAGSFAPPAGGTAPAGGPASAGDKPPKR